MNLNQKNTLNLIKDVRPDFDSNDFMDDRILSYLHESAKIYDILKLDSFKEDHSILNRVYYLALYHNKDLNHEDEALNQYSKNQIDVEEIVFKVNDNHKLFTFSFETNLNIVRFIAFNTHEKEDMTLCFIIKKADQLEDIDITRYAIPTDLILNKTIRFKKVDYSPQLKLQINKGEL